MSKVKEYSKRIMCILSAGMFFFMALFYPLESFKADVESVASEVFFAPVSWDVSYTDLSVSDSNLNKIPSQVDLGQYEINDLYTYFYFALPSQYLFSAQSNFYAYRILLSYDYSLTGNNILYNFYNISGSDQLIDLEGINTRGGELWYITNFANSYAVYLTPVFLLYEYHLQDSAGVYDFIYPSINRFSTSFSVRITPYTIENLTDEIYATLQNIYSNNTSMLTKLNQIYSSIDSVETKLQDLVDIAEQIETNTDELEGLLRTCNSYLASIKSELEEQTSLLQKIYNAIIEYFGLHGDDSVEEMPDQEMDNMLNIESELLGDASASDLQNDLNVSIDADSGSFVWNLIDRLITSNSVVFGGFISVLSLGIVALILGR